MARIRTLKPEHKLHRKVGLLSDRQYRLWIGMITEADDDGRLVADAVQLRAQVFSYNPRVRVQHVVSDLTALAAVGLVRLYRVGETPYADFPSWRDHQHLDRAHYRASNLPEFKPSEMISSLPVDAAEPLSSLGSEGKGRERNGREGKVVGGQAPLPATATANGTEIPEKLLEKLPLLREWPTPRALVALWNHHAAQACVPAVETLSEKRRDRAMRLLRQFEDWRYWNGALAKIKYSKFLTGKVAPSNGHSRPFVADFDWLLANSKTGVENVVTLAEGKYDS